MTFRNALLAIAACAAASGCSGGGSGDSGNGRIALAITDAPVDEVLEVNVRFSGVTLKPQGGDALEFVFDQPRDIDLLALAGGTTSELLPPTEVPAGAYNWIRLAVSAEFDNVFDSYAMLPTGQVELRVPGGEQSGLKLVSGFTVLAGSTTNLVIDWDLRKALSDPRGQPGLHLRPALRITDLATFGTLEGTVAAALVGAAGCTGDPATGAGNAVYVYDRPGVLPGDIGDAANEPLATASLGIAADGSYAYRVAFLAPGEYAAAFTCQAGADAVDSDDDIAFSAAKAFTIVDGQVTTVDF